MTRIGLALSGGGARGIAHIGIIKVLLKEGIKLHCIAGTSIGALVAAYYALNLEVKGLEEIALSFKKRDSLKLLDINDPRISLMKGVKARQYVQKIIGDATFADTKIPLRIAATALDDGEGVILQEGLLADAILASSTWPALFPITSRNGLHLVDGGLAGEIPVLACRDAGAEEVIAVDLFSIKPLHKEFGTSQAALERTYEILMSRLAHYREHEYGKVVMLRPDIGGHMELVDFYNADSYLKAGEAEARRMLPAIKRLR